MTFSDAANQKNALGYFAPMMIKSNKNVSANMFTQKMNDHSISVIVIGSILLNILLEYIQSD
jgi:hypothetical protein